MAEPAEKIRQTVADEIERRGYGVVELADRIGFSAPKLSRYLNRKGDITTVTLQRLLDALGLEVTRQRGRKD